MWADPANQNNSELEKQIKLEHINQNICLQVTYYYQQKSTLYLPSIKVQIKNLEQNKVLESELHQNSEDSWQIKEVKFELLTATEYTILIKVPKTVSIGGVSFCNGNNGK